MYKTFIGYDNNIPIICIIILKIKYVQCYITFAISVSVALAGDLS